MPSKVREKHLGAPPAEVEKMIKMHISSMEKCASTIKHSDSHDEYDQWIARHIGRIVGEIAVIKKTLGLPYW